MLYYLLIVRFLWHARMLLVAEWHASVSRDATFSKIPMGTCYINVGIICQCEVASYPVEVGQSSVLPNYLAK